jgi:hypothetical protein
MSYYGFDDPQAAANGVGAYFTQQPPQLPSVAGLGQTYYYVEPDDQISATAAATAGLLWLAARAAGGYVAGRAMAPSSGERNSWGAVGALIGTLGGPAGLGLMGVLALRGKTGG